MDNRDYVFGIDTGVPLASGPAIYFDNASTTPTFKSVINEISEIAGMYGNVNGSQNFHTSTSETYVVLPGIIDCHTHLGIIEEATGKIGVDDNETSDAVTPH